MADKKQQQQGCVVGSIITGIFVIWVVFSIIQDEIGNKSNYAAAPTASENENYSGGYRLTFGDDFKKGLAAQDDLGLSIVIAIDCSGSMDEYPKSGGKDKKFLVASQSLFEIVQFLEDFYKKNFGKDATKLKIGLIRFSSGVETLFPVTDMTGAAFEELKKLTADSANFAPDGKTALGKTLEKGSELLMQSGTIFKSLIIITDGENTEGEEPETVLGAIYNNANNKNTSDFPVTTSTILTSFVGFDVDSSVFGTLHNLGARVMSAGSKEDLNESLKNIFLADITKLESK